MALLGYDIEAKSVYLVKANLQLSESVNNDVLDTGVLWQSHRNSLNKPQNKERQGHDYGCCCEITHHETVISENNEGLDLLLYMSAYPLGCVIDKRQR